MTRLVSILMVDDERFIAYDLRRKLRRLVYAISAIVFFGRAAIDQVAATRLDLILIDMGFLGEMAVCRSLSRFASNAVWGMSASRRKRTCGSRKLRAMSF